MLCSYLEKFEGYVRDASDAWTEKSTSYRQLLKRQRLRSVTKLKNCHGRCLDVLESTTCVGLLKSERDDIPFILNLETGLYSTALRFSLNGRGKCSIPG